MTSKPKTSAWETTLVKNPTSSPCGICHAPADQCKCDENSWPSYTDVERAIIDACMHDTARYGVVGCINGCVACQCAYEAALKTKARDTISERDETVKRMQVKCEQAYATKAAAVLLAELRKKVIAERDETIRQLRECLQNILVPTNFISLDAARSYIEEFLELLAATEEDRS
jgi:hypothetical protein